MIAKAVLHDAFSVIAEIRRARGWEDFARLSDAELIEDMADRLTTDPDEHRLILCALALRLNKNIGREIEPVCARLDDLGIVNIDPQKLTAARHSTVNEHFEQALHELNPDGDSSQMDRIRELAISVGSIALNGADTGIAER
jgi:hypothetical protein